MRLWWRRVNAARLRYQSSTVAVGLILLVVVVFAQDQANDHDRFEDAERVTRLLRVQEINRAFESCQDTREFRATFAEFLDQSARPSSAGVNYAQLESFADLDPATKRFLEELAAVQSGGTTRVQTIADRYRERFFPLPDCVRIREESLARVPG